MQPAKPSRAALERQITPAEAIAIRATLQRAPTVTELPLLHQTIDHLHVVGRCPCGCDTVDFAHEETDQRVSPLGDGVGTTPAGGRVGIIVWGTEQAITELEVYSLGAADDDLRLPIPESIHPFVPDQT